MKASIIFLAFLFTIVATVSTSAQPGDKPITYASSKDADPQAKALLKQVKDQLKLDKGVVINFQFTYDPAEAAPSTQKGVVQLKNTSFRLTLQDQEISSDGKTLWTYLKKRNEVQINDAAEIQNDPLSPYRLIQIHDSPDFTYVIAGTSKVNGVLCDVIDFKPMDKNAEFFKIKAEIDRAKKQYKTISLYLKNGDQYTLSLSSQVNQNFADNAFVWNAAKYPGVKVEDLR